MKNSNLLIALAVSLFLTSCYSARICAPVNSNVTLANKGEALPIKVTKKNWYILWGLVPIGENSTNSIIKENGFTKVRVETKMKFVDFVISVFTGWVSVVTTTTTVEGVQTDSPSIEKKSTDNFK